MVIDYERVELSKRKCFSVGKGLLANRALIILVIVDIFIVINQI